MQDFITLITWSMNSVNNSRDSAKSIYKQLRKHRMNSLTTMNTDEHGISNEVSASDASSH